MLKETAEASMRCNRKGCLNPYFNGICSKRRNSRRFEEKSFRYVLILILMEHAQRALITCNIAQLKTSLNPYFNGTCSKRAQCDGIVPLTVGLNPYFNGTCSKRAFFVRPSVLICYIEIFTLTNALHQKSVPVFCLRHCKCNEFS